MTDTSTVFITITIKQWVACLSYLDANAINIKTVRGNNKGQYQPPSKMI